MSRVYPSAPLRSVVFEIRFPAELSIESRRHEYYQLVKDTLPNIFVPMPEQDKSLPLQPYTFLSEDKSKSVNFSINNFFYKTIEYGGFTSFFEDVKLYIHSFCNLFNITELKRTGLRYTNYILFEREDGIIPIHKFLNFSYNLPDSIPSKFEAFDTSFISKINEGKLRTEIGVVALEANPKIQAILLDLDLVYEGGLQFKKLGNYVQSSHTYIKTAFEGIITDQYRNLIKGGKEK